MTPEQPDVQRSIDRIQALVDMGRVEESRREALDAVARNPQEPRFWTALAVIENRRSDFPAAIKACERALAIDPSNVRAMFVLGPALSHSGKHAEAKKMMDALVEAAPQWAPGLVQRSLVYAWHIGTYISWNSTVAQRSVPHAEAQIVRENGATALALDPQNAAHYGQVAEARYLIHDVGVAVDLVDTGLRIAPTSEFLLMQKARFGLLNSRDAVGMARSILSMNPTNVDALRLLHNITWQRLAAVASWPSLMGALAATLAYSTFLFGGGELARGFLAVLLIPVVLGWAIMFSSLRSVASALDVPQFCRDNRLGLVGLILTMVANVGLIVGLVWLFIMPLKDLLALGQTLALFSVTVTVFAAGDMVMRIAASVAERRAGLYSDTPNGRFSAKQAARQQFDANVVRILIAFIVLSGGLPGGAGPGIEALTAMAAALVATVLVKKGTAAIMRSRRIAPTVWFVFGALMFCSALYCTALQVQIALG